MAQEIALIRLAAKDEALLQNLFQLYTHDFSDFWIDTPRGDLGPDGRFADYPLSPYWTRPNWQADLIRMNGEIAGFILINDETHSGLPADRNVAETFILRKYRRQGLAHKVVREVFDRHPGQWELAVARANLAALAFWQATVSSSAQASDLEELDLQSEAWNGPILRFRWQP